MDDTSNTEEFIKRAIDNNEFIEREIGLYIKKIEKKKQTEEMLKKVKVNCEGKMDTATSDKLALLVRNLITSNSNFTYCGCHHKVSFKIGSMKVKYEYEHEMPDRGRDDEPNTLYVDDNSIIEFDYDNGSLFENIGFHADEELTTDNKQMFIKISKEHFPEENPEHIFYFIMTIMSYYYDDD